MYDLWIFRCLSCVVVGNIMLVKLIVFVLKCLRMIVNRLLCVKFVVIFDELGVIVIGFELYMISVFIFGLNVVLFGCSSVLLIVFMLMMCGNLFG